MIHGINNNYLYAVTHIEAIFVKQGTPVFQKQEGTGFFVTKDNQVYFITNRHVVDITRKGVEFDGYKLNAISFDIRSYDVATRSVTTKKYNIREFGQVAPDNELDDVVCLCDLKIQGQGATVNSSFPFDMLADAECLDNQISVCDSLAIIGFPVVFDRLNNMPVLRSGVVSSDPRLNYSFSGKYMGQIIAYEAFSTDGSSGSPVIALQKGFNLGAGLSGPADFFRPVKVIGINAGCVIQTKTLKDDLKYQEHQQFSYMFKSNIIRDLIVEAEKEMKNNK